MRRLDLVPHDLVPHDLVPHDLVPHDFVPHLVGTRPPRASRPARARPRRYLTRVRTYTHSRYACARTRDAGARPYLRARASTRVTHVPAPALRVCPYPCVHVMRAYLRACVLACVRICVTRASVPARVRLMRACGLALRTGHTQPRHASVRARALRAPAYAPASRTHPAARVRVTACVRTRGARDTCVCTPMRRADVCGVCFHRCFLLSTNGSW